MNYTQKLMLALVCFVPYLYACVADIKGLEENSQEKAPMVSIISAENPHHKTIIDRNVALQKSVVLKTMLDNDPQAIEITIPATVNFSAVQFVIDALQIGFQAAKKAHSKLLQDAINEIYKAANYLDISLTDPLFHNLAIEYAQKLHANQDTSIKLATQLHDWSSDAQEYIMQIAKQYFFNYPTEDYSEDMDKKLGVAVCYSFQELVDHGLIGKGYLKRFPHLKDQPNALEENEKDTVLHTAIKLNDEKAVKALLKLGANIDMRNRKNGETPLHLAVSFDLNNMATLLIRHGANVNTENALKYTPLHTAALRRNVPLVKVLLAKDAHINAVDSTGEYTPLDCAIQANAKDIATVLVKAGAAPPQNKERREKLKNWGLTN